MNLVRFLWIFAFVSLYYPIYSKQRFSQLRWRHMFHQVNAAFKYKHVHNRNTREQKWIPSLLCNFVFIIITRSYSFVFKCKDIIKRKLLHHWVHFVDLFIRPDDAMSNSWRDWVHFSRAVLDVFFLQVIFRKSHILLRCCDFRRCSIISIFSRLKWPFPRRKKSR